SRRRSGSGEGPAAPCVCRVHRRDLRALPEEGDRRGQRARRRDLARGGPRGSGARLRAPARRRPAAQVRPATSGDPGRGRLLRAHGPGHPQVAAAAARRSDVRLRDELPQVRRRRARRAGARMAGARAARRPAEARRGHGRGRARVLERDRVYALVATRGVVRRPAAVHAHGAGARVPRHRRVARRAGREGALLERLQGARCVVGRAAAVLENRRVLAFAALATAVGAYYAWSDSLPNVSLWWDVAFLALVLIPAVFALVYLALPLRRTRGLLLLGLAFGLVTWAFIGANLDALANFSKLAATTALAFWFVTYFDTAGLVVFVAALVPLVDAYSVWRGPTGNIVEHHPQVFTNVSFALPVPV